MSFIPVRRSDMEARGWKQLDFIFVSGDAYVDHPSFVPAILCRLLEPDFIWIGSVMALIVLIKHRANIGRLLRGEEPKMSFKK